jgi:beta-lactam-binding protein with PASTA domain
MMGHAGLKLGLPIEGAPGRDSGIVVDQKPAAGYKVDGGVKIQVQLK